MLFARLACGMVEGSTSKLISSMSLDSFRSFNLKALGGLYTINVCRLCLIHPFCRPVLLDLIEERAQVHGGVFAEKQ